VLLCSWATLFYYAKERLHSDVFAKDVERGRERERERERETKQVGGKGGAGVRGD